MADYKYVGKGDYITGVPARDLEDDEVKALDKETRAALTASGLYERKETKSKDKD